jgi:exonuclease III
MKLLFWNIRGWGQKDRRRQVNEFTNKEKADFVGLQETLKEDFSDKELKQVGGRYEFVWNWLPAEGHSGGILLGVKQDVVEVGAFDEGTFFVSALLKHMKTDFKWEVVVVYGPAQHDRLELFLEELK